MLVSLVAGVRSSTAQAQDSSPPIVREEQIKELCSLVKSDPSFKVRTSAARKLGDLATRGARNKPEVVRALIDALADREHIVRGVAAHSLGRHGSPDALRELEKVSRQDSHPFVRESATHALAENRPAPPMSAAAKPAAVVAHRLRRIELGKVQLAKPASGDSAPGLREAIADAIDDLLGDRKPAIFPREDADVRLDLEVRRVGEAPGSSERSISYQANVLIVELPSANLRHASKATATMKTKKKSVEIEKKLALEAATRAVNEALAMIDSN